MRFALFFILFLVTLFKLPIWSVAGEWAISSYPLFKICKEIFAEESLYLIQPPKGEFHFAEPSPREWDRIRRAELVVIVGTERWAKRVYNIQKKENVISLLREGEKPLDPHLWFDFERVERFLRALLAHPQVQRKPSYERYQKRVEEFLTRLNSIRQSYLELGKCPRKEIYNLGHKVFYYLLKDTQVKEIPLIRGHHHGEPSMKSVREVIARAKEKRVTKIVVTESAFLRHREFFEKEGIQLIEAWSGDRDVPGSFLELLEKNLNVFKKILDC